MPEPISAGHTAAKNALHRTTPEVWLFELDLDGVEAFRICTGDAEVVFAGQTYKPFPVAVEGLEMDTDTTLPAPTVTVGNLSSEMAGRLEAGELLDRPVRIYQANTADATFVIDLGRFVITAASLTAHGASFALGLGGTYDARGPARLQSRSRCDNIYGDAECGYETALPNLISGTEPDFDPATCDLSLDGANGCEAHGRNEVACGRPQLHPLWMGAHKAIPKGQGRL